MYQPPRPTNFRRPSPSVPWRRTGGAARVARGRWPAHIRAMLDATVSAPEWSAFVQPQEPSAAAAIEAVREELEVFDDWMDRYGYIIELGRTLPSFPAAWQDDAHRVPGCQSKVWMETAMRDGALFLAGASDAAIVSGLVALLLRVYSGRPPAEVAATDPVFLKELGLLENLSSNRGSGVASMARKIREAAVRSAAGAPG